MEKLLRRDEVEDLVGLATTSIYRLMRAGSFPEPLRIGARAVRCDDPTWSHGLPAGPTRTATASGAQADGGGSAESLGGPWWAADRPGPPSPRPACHGRFADWRTTADRLRHRGGISMAAQPLYQSHITADADQSRDQNAANIPRIDRRPWVVRVREACKAATLSPTDRLVAITVASYFDADGGWSVSMAQIKGDTGLHLSSVFRSLKRLREQEIINVASGQRRPVSGPLRGRREHLEDAAGRSVRTVAPCDRTVAPCDRTVAPCDKTVAPCDRTVAPCDTYLS